MRFQTLKEWLEHTRTVHALGVDLGLDRVRVVAERMGLLKPNCVVITIAGTNGKGSCVAGLEAIYRAEGYRVGAFTTPYLFHHNEQVRVQGVNADDLTFCQAFEKVEVARADITLTQFEFNTLVALQIFQEAKLDVILLEVGLGGRLDAVNIIDADLAIIASIALDHVDWLGNTRDLIAIEKAGVLRSGKPAVCGDPQPPQSLKDYAEEMQVPLYCQMKDFFYISHRTSWTWQSEKVIYEDLPLPALALQNMSTVLKAVELLQERLPVLESSITTALANVQLTGRIQILPGEVTHIVDVSHNPAAAELLSQQLKCLPCRGKTHAVFSMLADKDIAGSLQSIKEMVDCWYIAELPEERAASIGVLHDAFRLAHIDAVKTYATIEEAYLMALKEAEPEDRIIVFGSFYTVAGVGTVMKMVESSA